MIETEKYIRKPLYVNAVRVTEENFDNIAVWCSGTVDTEAAGSRVGQQFIKVNVHGIPKSQRQTKAFVGDWLLHTERGFKVYTDNAFRASFNPAEENPREGRFAVAEDVPVVPDGVDAQLVRPPVESVSVTPATPEAVANGEVQPIVSDSPSAPPPQTADGKRILTVEEQRELTPIAVRDLVRSGEVVLAQDVEGGVQA